MSVSDPKHKDSNSLPEEFDGNALQDSCENQDTWTVWTTLLVILLCVVTGIALYFSTLMS
jgi:hypothetical protein